MKTISHCPYCGHHLHLPADMSPAYCPICDKELIRCSECGDVLECMCVVGADESGTGKTERLYVCHGCLASWSQSTNEGDGTTDPIERYFFWLRKRDFMTIKEKQFIAAHARELIVRLQFCEDSEFVDFIIACVASGDTLPLEPENLQ